MLLFKTYYMWKNIREQYKNSKLKITAPTWNDEFELPDGSYSVSYIQNYIEYIIKKHETLTVIPSKVAVISRHVSTQQNLWSKFSTLHVLLTEYFFYFLQCSFCNGSHEINIKSFE